VRSTQNGRIPIRGVIFDYGNVLCTCSMTRNLPFQEWTEVLGSERLTGALLDRLTHHVHILEMNGESYRLKQCKRKRGSQPNS
jgi:DNA replication protein DnaC